MSDRLAVFNRGRIEQIGAPARGLRAAGDAVRRRLRRHVEPAQRRGGAKAIVGEDGTVHGPAREDPPRGAATTGRGPDESRRGGTIRKVVYLGPGHALHRRARCGRRAGRHRSRTCTTSSMEALAAEGQAGPAGLEATARAPPSQAVTREQWTRRREHVQRRISGVLMTVACCAACGPGSAAAAPTTPRGEQPAARRRRPHDRADDRRRRGDRPGEGELNLVIWAGYAERGAVDPAYDWVTPFEEETGCKVTRPGHDRLEQRRLADAVRASTTASRPPATRRPG